MKNIDNKQLDEIGRELLKANKMRTGEIEQIVNRPQLFDSVLTQIRLEENRRARESAAGKSFAKFGFGKLALAFGALAILVAGAGWLRLRNQSSPSAAIESLTARQLPPVQPIVNTPISTQPAEPKIDAGEITETFAFTGKRAAKATKDILHTNLKKQFTGRGKIIVKAKQPNIPSPIDKTEPFYALNDAGNFDATISHPIVRMEISRIQLYSLGANIPVENAPQTVVADLLIGNDGNPRAYRLVR